jgi:hypothetical protein
VGVISNVEHASPRRNHPHPNPLPEYRERGPEAARLTIGILNGAVLTCTIDAWAILAICSPDPVDQCEPYTGGLLCIDPADRHVECEFSWRGTRRESVNACSGLI